MRLWRLLGTKNGLARFGIDYLNHVEILRIILLF